MLEVFATSRAVRSFYETFNDATALLPKAITIAELEQKAVLVPRLCLDHSQLSIAILQHIVGRERLAPLAITLQPPQGDGVLAANAAAWGNAPASGHQHGVDMVAAGFCFVLHVLSLSLWPTAELSSLFAAQSSRQAGQSKPNQEKLGCQSVSNCMIY